MNGKDKEELQELLQKFVHTIYSTVNDSMAKDALKPENRPYIRHKLIKFEYGDTGIINKRVKSNEFLKPSWYRAANDIFFEEIINRKVYKDTLRAISNSYGIERTRRCHNYLWLLTAIIARDILEGKVQIPKQLAEYVTLFLRDLNEEDHEYRAEVQLRGLILQSNSIQLDGNVKLRKPTRKDFESEEPRAFRASRYAKPIPLEDPTAFLNIKIYTKAENTLHFEIGKAIELLRLFRVGSVQDIRYSTDIDSIINEGRYIFTAEQLLGQDNYLITKEDVTSLKTFWLNMKRLELPIPVQRGVPREPTALSISYERYSNALDETIFENRVFSAVMGLEALYLSEEKEMSYRLRMRVSKLLGLIGYNHYEVREKIKDAYEVRSTYVHGGTLKQKDRRKLERKYSGLTEFSKTITDYLRASIVALLKRPSKTSLIQKLDDSFLDSKKDEEIKKLLFMPYEKEELNA